MAHANLLHILDGLDHSFNKSVLFALNDSPDKIEIGTLVTSDQPIQRIVEVDVTMSVGDSWTRNRY